MTGWDAPLDLPPLGNPRLLDVVTGDLLDTATCDVVVAGLDPTAWTAAHVASERTPAGGGEDRSARRAVEQPLPGTASEQVTAAVLDAVVAANAASFRFELTGLEPADPLRVVCYRASDHGFFGEHLDLAVRFSTRKVSVTVQLSAPDDYDGGDLLVGGTEHPGGRPRGAVTVFPAWRTHGVAPVRRGERLAIVGWVHGPAFR